MQTEVNAGVHAVALKRLKGRSVGERKMDLLATEEEGSVGKSVDTLMTMAIVLLG